MKLTERAHQTSDDLTVVNAVYSWHVLFWRTTVYSVYSARHAHYLLSVRKSSRWKYMILIEIKDVVSKTHFKSSDD